MKLCLKDFGRDLWGFSRSDIVWVECLQGESDTFCDRIKGDDLCLHRLTRMDLLFEVLRHIRWDLRQVDETRDSSIKFEEYTKLRKAEDRSFDDITDLVFISEDLPRIRLETFDRERDLLSFDADDLDSHFITDLRMFMRVIHMSPVDL